MNKVAKRRWLVAMLEAGMLVLAMGFASPAAYAQAASPTAKSNLPSEAERSRFLAIAPQPGKGQLNLACDLSRPSQIQRYFVVCTPGTTQIEVAIADCCIPGDHWQVKVKAWDASPNTAVQTAPPNNVFSPPAQVLNYGGTAHNRDLEALVECSYIDGVDVWPAGSSITVASVGGTCTSTNLGLEDAIDRTP